MQRVEHHHVIGWLGRPTRDGRCIGNLVPHKPVVPVISPSGQHVGHATGLAIDVDDARAIRCVTDIRLRPGDVLSINIGHTRPPETIDGVQFMFGELLALTILPEHEWAWHGVQPSAHTPD